MIATRFNSAGRSSWPVLFVVILVAGAAWGIYAWRFAGEDSEANPPSPAAASEAQSNGDRLPPASTGLRATRPTAEANRNSPPLAGDKPPPPSGDSGSSPQHGLSGGVTPNAPPGNCDEIEMSLTDPPPPSPATAMTRLDAARRAVAEGDLLSARVALSAALKAGLSPDDAAFARSECARIADALLFSRVTLEADPLSKVHLVGSGETLNSIARQHRISETALISLNQISDPRRLHVGTRLKVIKGPFRATIDKSQHRLDVLLGDVVVRSYRVGLGTNGGTPTGAWVVRDKLLNPDWTDPTNGRHYPADDPENPIGEHWIGLDCRAGECLGRVGFGIHGTIEPQSIGANQSMGCVRLAPEDVAFLYDLLVIGQSTVTIR